MQDDSDLERTAQDAEAEREYQQALRRQGENEQRNAYSTWREQRGLGLTHYDLGIEDGRPGLEPDGIGVATLLLRAVGILVLLLTLAAVLINCPKVLEAQRHQDQNPSAVEP